MKYHITGLPALLIILIVLLGMLDVIQRMIGIVT